MELIEIAKLTSKGQVTVAAPIRAIFNLKKGSSVISKVTDKGVFFLPCEITERETYTQEEWGKNQTL
jgi:bifunctional DNA-binding transcriptional regulator/antitoxin component of YhaV-PrlF toxin-antitoxin module